MKRYFYLTAAIAGLLMAASCQKEDFAGADGDYAEVSFTADLPGSIATRAIADGQTVNKLHYEVYTVADADGTPTGDPVYDEVTDVTDGKATVNVRLIKNKPYTVFFWAQYEDDSYTSPYTVTDLKNITVSYDNALANDEKRDAFYAVVKNVKYASATTAPVKLNRPFAQVNVATSDVDILTRDGVSLTGATSTLTVTNVANTFSLFDGKATAEDLAAGETELDATFTTAAIPDQKLYNVGAENKSYDYLAMAYILVPNTTGEGTSTSVSTISSEVTVTGLEGPVTISYEGATVQQNRRTNLVGPLLTTSADYMVEVDNKFDEPEHDHEYENVTNVDAANTAFASGNTTSVRIEEIEEDATVILPQTTDETTILLPETDATVTFTYPANATEEPEVLNITAPEGTSIVLEVENTTVYINGVLQTVTSTTAENTLYVTEGTVIENLIVVKGNVRIEKGGVVNNISISDDADEELTVKVYLGEDVVAPIVAEADKDKIVLIPFTTPETEASFVEQVKATTYGKVTLTEDVVLEDALTINADQDITIDLNGFTISQEKVQDTGYSMIVNNGKLTIMNEGKIIYADKAVLTKAINYVSNVIVNNGILTIEKGVNVINDSDKSISEFGYPHAIDNNGTMTINGGVFTNNTDYSSIRIWCTEDDNTKVTINGGTFNGCIDLHNVNTKANKGTLIINDGIFNADTYTKCAVRLLGFGTDVDEINCYISGGTFNGNIKMRNYVGGEFNSDVFHISGGTFSTFDVLTYMSEGEKATFKLEDGRTIVIDDIDATTKYVTNLEEMKNVLTAAGAAGAGNTTIHLMTDIDMADSDWSPIAVDGYHGADVVTIEGHGSTITGLKAGLFKGGFAGGSGIVIKDLTISDSEIVADNTQGYGAFVGCADSMDEITLVNCHLVNSSIITPNDGAAESRIGGLIGWTAGYNNQNDGPVDSYITVEKCSVTGCTLKGAGSIGGLVGHSGANAATYTIIKDCVVSDNELISTDDGDWRVGVVVGTANNGQTTISGITESSNTLEQTGKTAPTGEKRNYYGRFVPSGTGTLTIDGTKISE